MTAGRATGRILGNLTCEDELARGAGPGRSGVPISRQALAAVAGAATLLRALARPGDRLWTPAPVAPERVTTVPGLPEPRLEAGPLSALAPAAEVLAWCETPAAAAHRTGGRQPTAVPEGGPLHELLWSLPPPAPEVVAAVHHRAFCLEVATGLGCALPGARMLSSLSELEAHLTGGEASPAGVESWVVKAPLSAAGRSRYVARGGGITRPEVRRRVEGLFARHGSVLFEPWMDRTADLGCAVLLTSRGARLVGVHRLLVDVRGQFTGIELGAACRGFEGLPGQDRERLEEVVEGVARSLGRAGYRGPFGIDAWWYRTAGGAVALHPLGEINARMTFGLVARVLVDRLREPLELGEGDKVRLTLGARGPAGDGRAGGAVVVPLLLPGEDGSAGAWIEVLPGPSRPQP